MSRPAHASAEPQRRVSAGTWSRAAVDALLESCSDRHALDEETCFSTLTERDPDYEVPPSTSGCETDRGMFCRPTCPAARRQARELRVLRRARKRRCSQPTGPCERCRPLSHPNETSDVVRRLVGRRARAATSAGARRDFDALAVHASTARRQFKRRFGMTFVEYARARRLGAAFKAIRAGERVIDGRSSTPASKPEQRLSRRVRAASWARRLPAALTRALFAAGSIRRSDPWPRSPTSARSTSRIRRPARARARDRAAAARGQSRHRAGSDRADRADRSGARRRTSTGRSHAFETPLARAGSPFQNAVWDALLDDTARRYAELRRARARRRPAARPCARRREPTARTRSRS